jgi:hypothetical protein
MGKMGTPEHTSVGAACMQHRGLMYLEVSDHPPLPSLYHFLSLTKSKSLPAKAKSSFGHLSITTLMAAFQTNYFHALNLIYFSMNNT